MTVAPSADASFVRAVEDLGGEAYSVETVALRKHRRNKSKIRVSVPLFSGYVFVRFDPSMWGKVQQIKGYAGTLRDKLKGELAPSTISDVEVRSLVFLSDYSKEHGVDLRRAVPFSVGEKVEVNFFGTWISAAVKNINRNGNVLAQGEYHGRKLTFDQAHDKFRKVA